MLIVTRWPSKRFLFGHSQPNEGRPTSFRGALYGWYGLLATFPPFLALSSRTPRHYLPQSLPFLISPYDLHSVWIGLAEVGKDDFHYLLVTEVRLLGVSLTPVSKDVPVLLEGCFHGRF